MLSTALKTPEHSGRIRKVRSFISPSKYFSLPKKKRNRLSKSEMMVHEQETMAELERTKEELARTKKDFSSQIDELKAMMVKLTSSNLSDKASCRIEPVEELMANNEEDDNVIAIDPVRPPSPPGNKVNNCVHARKHAH